MHGIGNALRNRIGQMLTDLAVRFFGKLILQRRIFAVYEYPKIRQQYGDFRLDQDYSKQHIRGLSKESGAIRGVIVDIVKNLKREIDRVLLPGEYNVDKLHYSKLFGIDESKIITAGLGGDTDYEWDYEKEPPKMGEFDIIISQAMLEHLLNPYQHVVDLSSMLNPGGKLVIHTHIPGFEYHRYPIDCLRFYPDWFEEVAERLDLSVYDRYIGDLRICYTLQRHHET